MAAAADGGSARDEAATQAAPGGGRARVLGRDAAVLMGLAGVAITQPLLELLGDNPTFFVAGRYSSGQITAFALTVALIPAAVLFVVTALPGLFHRRTGRIAHALAVWLLAGLFAVMACRTAGVDGLIKVGTAAIAAGTLVAVAEWRVALVRNFLGYLALGNLAFVVLFLMASPTAELIGESAAGGQEGRVAVPPLDGPVLLVILDELPVTSLIRPDGTINDTRYPNFARLADRSTWFRNAASESRSTYVSVPSILTGRHTTTNDLPTLNDHPRNLFTLFGDRYPVNRYETVTDMCPRDVCHPPPGGSFGALIDDAVVAYQHRVLPSDMRDDLPPVDSSWGDFADALDARVTPEAYSATPPTTTMRGGMDRYKALDDDERSPSAQAGALLRGVSLVDDDPTINLVHVLLPHAPYLLTPWGTGEMPTTWMPDGSGTGNTELPDRDDPAYDVAFRQVYPLQALQLGAVDRLIGEVMDGLEQRDAWDDALVVVTSDHGTDVSPPGFGKFRGHVDLEEALRIPLFVKAPGQVDGEIRDDPASTLDVLPTIVDLLDIETGWDFDGRSLFHDRAPVDGREPVDGGKRVGGREPASDRPVAPGVEAAFDVSARQSAWFPRGEDWDDLAAVGEGEELVGLAVDDLTIGDESELGWDLDHEELLADLSVADGPVPYLLRGIVTGTDRPPPELVVSVNGTVAGAVGAYRRAGDAWAFSGFMAPYFREGRNDVVAYEVDRSDEEVVLHPVGAD